MAKAPKYIWLSIFAFIWLAGTTTWHIKFSKKYFENRFCLLNRANLNIVKLGFLYIFLPNRIWDIVVDHILSIWIDFDSIPQDALLSELTAFVALIVAYIFGVIATYKHHLWRVKNIPHLLED